MIRGIGHDLVHVPRIADIIERWGLAFLRKVFSEAERAYCGERAAPAQHYAARFAAKEAFYKAVSGGRTLPLGFRDAELVHRPGNSFALEVSSKARTQMAALYATTIHVSVSHDGQ